MAVYVNNDVLDYTTQAILGVQDKDLYGSVEGFKTSFKDTVGKTTSKILSDTRMLPKMFGELSTLTGSVTNLPAVIRGSADLVLTPLKSVEIHLTNIDNTVTNINSAVSSNLPQIVTALSGFNTSLEALKNLSKEDIIAVA